MKKIYGLIGLLSISFFSCVSDHYTDPNLSGECVTITPNLEVSAITSTATSTVKQYLNTTPTTKKYMEAIVTSSDIGGNFYKSISFQSVDGTLGFSMPVDNYNLYTKYEPGRKVYIQMDSLYYKKQDGSTIIGQLYEGGVGRISGVKYPEIIKASCTSVNEESIVIHLNGLASIKNDQYLNKLIEVDNVGFKPQYVGKKYFSTDDGGGATNNLIADEQGNEVVTRISQYATFADNIVPSETGKIRGVLTKYGSTYQFMVRSLTDIKLTQPRIFLFQETFPNAASLNNWTVYSVTGTEGWNISTQYGAPAPCVMMSGFNGSSHENEDWLISPVISMTGVTQAKFQFDTAKNYTGNTLKIYVSSNYTSGNPSTATWTEVTGNLSTGSFAWKNSGPISLNSFAGQANVRIAFKYTSTNSASSTWELDNIIVTGN